MTTATLTLTMPRLGETMDEGLIVGWMVARGEAFKRGQPILELETDKTVVEFPALGDGTIDVFLAGPGDRVAVGKPIATASVASAADWAEDHATPPNAPAAAAPSILRMPRLGETMETGIVGQWLVAEGATYARGDAILEVETDKTMAEVPALYEGRLLRILAQPGEKLPVGAPIAEVDGKVEDIALTDTLPKATAPGESANVTVQDLGGRRRATPVARRIARQHGVALDRVSGTGRRGRIEAADVKRAATAAGSLPAPGELNWLDLADGRLAYSVTGTAGDVYLLIHGFAGDRSAWAQLSAILARAGQTVVMPDLPGHGATTGEAADPGALADAITRLVATFSMPVTLVGHSLGAAVAVIAAARLGHRVARVVLLTPAGCGPTIGADFVHGMAEAQTPGEVAHLLRLLGPKGGTVSGATLVQMAAELSRGRLKALAQTLATTDGRQRIDLLRPLAQLAGQVPVMAVFGTEDQVVPATDALNLPPQVAAHFLPSGHMPQWDCPRELTDLILKGHTHG